MTIRFIPFAMACVMMAHGVYVYAGDGALDDVLAGRSCYIFKHGNDQTKSRIIVDVEEFTTTKIGKMSRQSVIDLLGAPDLEDNRILYYYFKKNTPGSDDCCMKFEFGETSVLKSVVSTGMIRGISPYQSKDLDAPFWIACAAFKTKVKTSRYAESCVISNYISLINKQFDINQLEEMLGSPDLKNGHRLNYIVMKSDTCVVYLEFLFENDSRLYRVDLSVVSVNLYNTLFKVKAVD